MTLSIATTGKIKVLTSVSMPIQVIERFLKDNHNWVVRKQEEYERLRRAHPPKSYEEGEKFLFLGDERELIVVKAQVSRLRVGFHENRLVLWSPQKSIGSAPEKVREALVEFYKAEGERTLKQRVEFWAEAMGLWPTGLSFRSQRTRWGSCTSRGRITLNWKLIAAPASVQDYVVVHELAHLAHCNHSASFWDLVKKHIFDVEERKRWLRENHYNLDFLSNTSELHSP